MSAKKPGRQINFEYTVMPAMVGGALVTGDEPLFDVRLVLKLENGIVVDESITARSTKGLLAVIESRAAALWADM